MSEVISISELNRRVKATLERSFPLLWVGGEISNLTRATSGHIYFSLKDAGAQVRCVMFRSRAQLLPWRLENGQQVEAQVLVSLYEARGDFQLNIEGLRRAGLGQRFEAFNRLKAKLEQEGLFAPEGRQAIPIYPRCIGIISSPQAAALRDILIALRRRAPHVPVILYPTPVQGENAGAQIADAIAIANQRNECDVLLLARGGGSIEDLWAFNEEVLARAVHTSHLPVICGVGHETDVTIADFVADMRAATPTAAAEIASAGWFAARNEARRLSLDLRKCMRAGSEKRMQALDLLAHRLTSPQERLGRLRQDVRHWQQQLAHHTHNNLLRQTQKILRLGEAIKHLGPESTLARGYSIVRNEHGEIVRSAAQLQAGQGLELSLAQGSAQVRVEKVREG